MAAHQALLSLGFSRQEEHWSGLPFPSPMHESEKWKWSCSVMSDSSWPHGLQPTRLLRPWDFPDKSTGVGCHCLLWCYILDIQKLFIFITRSLINIFDLHLLICPILSLCQPHSIFWFYEFSFLNSMYVIWYSVFLFLSDLLHLA